MKTREIQCMEWQAIETAPTDPAEPVDLWLVGSRSAIDFYCPVSARDRLGLWAGRATAMRWDDGWRPICGLHRLHKIEGAEATHWMPIPKETTRMTTSTQAADVVDLMRELAELRAQLTWRQIESAPAYLKDGREFVGLDQETGAKSVIRWSKHNHVPLWGWIRQIELYGEEVDGFSPTHYLELPEGPPA